MSQKLSSRRAWLALVAMVPAVLVVGLDVTVLSVALPTLARDLTASTGQLQWFVMAYTITYAAAIVPSGLLGDRFGRRGVLVGSLVVFTVGSLACALSSTAGTLIVARALLGIGAAGIATLSTAMVNVLFSDSERGRAMTLIMLVNVIGFPLGPILGGWLLAHVSWGWIFMINVPIAILAVISVLWLIPESRSKRRPTWDVPGLASISVAIVLVCYGLTQAESESWGQVSVWLPTIVAIALVVVFVGIERRAAAPLVPLALFRRRRFAAGSAAAVLMSFVIAGLLFVVPQYAQAILGASTQGSGFYLLSFAAGMLIAFPLAPKLSGRLGDGGTITIGLITLALSLFLATATTPTTPGWWLVAWAALAGGAFGLGLPIAMAIGDVDVDASGVGSAVLQSLRQVGTAIGVALLGSILSAGYRTSLLGTAGTTAREGVEQGLVVAQQTGSTSLADQVRTAFMHGMSWVCLTSAIVSILAAVILGLGLLVRRAHPNHHAPEKRAAQ
ncbi:MAG: MFS transporter [Bifidobacterium tibiigranuli]|jgi:EmrB/QacA subfamily drug resistance transporter|nr:MFS transporter [Bifidobacterium tibiigranuli]